MPSICPTPPVSVSRRLRVGGNDRTFVLIRTAIAALVCGAVLGAGATLASAQEVPGEYQGVLKTMGKGGDY